MRSTSTDSGCCASVGRVLLFENGVGHSATRWVNSLPYPSTVVHGISPLDEVKIDCDVVFVGVE